MPWSPRTPQERGRARERGELRKRAMRQHPASGAGKIKLDGSNATHLAEVKSAARQITLDGEVLKRDMIRALRQGRRLSWLIVFEHAGVTAEVTVRRT